MNIKLISVIGILLASNLAFSQTPTVIEKGRQIAIEGNCIGCHTSDQSKPFAGGVPLDSPIGKIFSTNITPDRENGIGNYTFEDFDQAIRKGKTKEGHYLYPAMPYDVYAKLTDEDMQSLYAYFMNDVSAVNEPNKNNEIDWPLNMRWPLSIWSSMFANESVFEPRKDKSDQYNRGAYLVESLGHCGTCHTPRSVTLASKGTDPSSQTFLSGAELGGWYAPDLRRLAKYNDTELFSLLKEGYSHKDVFSGPMQEVSSQSLSHLPDDDIESMVFYLRAIALPENKETLPVNNNIHHEKGEQLYQTFCSTCHGVNGEGIENVIPQLRASFDDQALRHLNIMNIVVHGGKTDDDRSKIGYIMPAYGHLENEDISEIVNFVVDNPKWENYGKPVTASDVANIKKGVSYIKGWWFIVGGIIILIALVFILRKLFKRKK